MAMLHTENLEQLDTISTSCQVLSHAKWEILKICPKSNYFGTISTNPGKIVKIALSNFSRVNALTLESGESGLASAVVDPAGDFAYFGTWTDPGAVAMIFVSAATLLSATKSGMVGTARLT